jgi:hypothetical protein
METILEEAAAEYPPESRAWLHPLET